MLSFKPAFSLSSFTFIKKLFSSSSLSAIRVVSSAYLSLLPSPLLITRQYQLFFLVIATISDGKASACNVGDLGSIPGLGRSLGEGNGNPLQYSCLVGYSPWDHKESDTTEGLHFHFHHHYQCPDSYSLSQNYYNNLLSGFPAPYL